MLSIDVANYLITKYGNKIRLTNLSINKLVYYCQVESLRLLGRPLFVDRIEAWEYGPVEPAVYHAFKGYGRSTIHKPATPGGTSDIPNAEEATVIDSAMKKYGDLTAYDLVELSHRKGGAWSNKFDRSNDIEITTNDIVSSDDYKSEPDLSNTFLANVESIEKEWRNTIRILGDA